MPLVKHHILRKIEKLYKIRQNTRRIIRIIIIVPGKKT